MSANGPRSTDDWLCKKCTGKDGSPFRNFGFRAQCWSCKVARGACFGKKAEPRAGAVRLKPPAANGGKDKDTDKYQREKKALERSHAQELQKLRGELDEVRKSIPDRAREPASAECSVEVDGEVELDAAVSRARVRAKLIKDMPESMRDLVAGGYETCLAKVQAELAEAQGARRAANPLKKRLEGAETHKARMAKKVAEAKAALQDREAALEAVSKQIVAHKVALEEAEAFSAKASAEVAALAAKYALERTDTTNTAHAGANGGGNAPHGFVSVSFAEEKWAEREAAFAQQIAQLQALVASQGEGGAAASDASPSVAGDIAAMEDLEDDEAWSKVTREKRKTVLRRERDVLASKVRSSLGKSPSHASPFKFKKIS
jgi:hypothetical protein